MILGEFIRNNFVPLIITFFVVGFIIFAIVKRKDFAKKIKQESISFIAMVFSIALALLNFAVKPAPLPISSLSSTGEIITTLTISIGVPLFLLVLVTSIIFFIPKGGK